MILTCPNCNSKFNVSLDELGNTERNVRCSACLEEWVETSHIVEGEEDQSAQEDEILTEAVEEEGLQDTEVEALEQEEGETDDFQEIDIPEAVKPEQGEEPSKGDSGTKEKYIAYGIAASIFLIVFISLLFSSTSIMRSYPSMQDFYGVMGVHMDLPTSKEVTFGKVKAQYYDSKVKLSGEIINLSDEPQTLTMIEAALTDGKDKVFEYWHITPRKVVLAPEEVSTFSSEYDVQHDEGHSEAVHEDDNHGATEDGESQKPDIRGDDVHKSEEHVAGKKYVRIRFVLSPRIDEEAYENIPTPHASESDHQSDHAASL